MIVNLKKKNRYPNLRNVGLFYVWEDARVWTHWNHSFHMHLSSLEPVSCIFTSWVSLELTGSWRRAAVADGCDIFCLLISQEIFHLSVPSALPSSFHIWKFAFSLPVLIFYDAMSLLFWTTLEFLDGNAKLTSSWITSMSLPPPRITQSFPMASSRKQPQIYAH